MGKTFFLLLHCCMDLEREIKYLNKIVPYQTAQTSESYSFMEETVPITIWKIPLYELSTLTRAFNIARIN